MRYLLLVLICLLAGCTTGDRDNKIVVSVPDQKLRHFHCGQLVAEYPVSTSKFGLGDRPGSNATPLGVLRIKEKIGDGAPAGAVFKGRRPTGEVLPPNAPGRDPIVSRILWLDGTEARNASAHRRFIYIHGTPEESRIGTPASYGCIRMKSNDVIRLFASVGRGAEVRIVNRPLEPRPASAQPAEAVASGTPASTPSSEGTYAAVRTANALPAMP